MRVFPLYDFEYDLIPFCPDTPIIQGNTGKISLLSREVLDQYIQRSNPFEAEKIKQNLAAFQNISSKESFVDYFSNAKKHQGTIGYTSYSFIDIFQKKQQTPEGEMIDLKDKIVLIGEVGTLMQDSHLTPVFQNMKMPGVEINANILTTLLQGRVIQEVSFLVLFLSMFLIQVMLISLVVTQKTLWSCVSLFLSILFIIIAGSLLFDV